MVCSICRDLEMAYQTALDEYIEACSSACYRVSRKLAAQKNVDMERARYELEEHRMVCATFARVPALLPQPDRTVSLRQMVA